MTQAAPKITIIVAVYNAKETLQQCIDSVVKQSYLHVELIIIDGGSTDGSLDVIKQNKNKISYWVSEPDTGIYNAWNKGLAKASGDWVAFLGADDVYLPNALKSYVDYLLTHQNESFEYLSSRVNLVQAGKYIRTIGNAFRWTEFRRYMSVAHVGSLHHKSLYERYGVYDTNYKVCADYEFLLRPKQKLKAGFLNQVTVQMSVGGASDSIAALLETARIKVATGGRAKFLAIVECKLAVFRMHIRKRIWY